MDEKLAFQIIKVLEYYSLSKLRDFDDEKTFDYSLLFLLPSYTYTNFIEWTLVIEGKWLEEYDNRTIIKELLIAFKEKMKNTTNDRIIGRISFISAKDSNFSWLRERYNSLFSNRYYDAVSNFNLGDEIISEAYIIKSKILSKIKFGKQLNVLHRVADGAKYRTENRNFIFINVDNESLLALNKKGESVFKKNKPLKTQPELLLSENHIKVSIYDIFNIEDSENLPLY